MCNLEIQIVKGKNLSPGFKTVKISAGCIKKDPVECQQKAPYACSYRA